MPTIWLRNTAGTVFHLSGARASWEGEFNTPDTPLPTSAVVNQDRCANTLSIQSEKEILTLDVSPEGRTGACAQCGQCCSHPRESCEDKKACGYERRGKYHTCKHLIEYPQNGGIGSPGGTACGIRRRLLDTHKGCVEFPSSKDDISPLMTACGMRFE